MIGGMPHAPVLTIASPDGRTPLVFNWGVSSLFGWGLYGLNLMLELADHPRYVPMCAIEIEPGQLVLDPDQLNLIHTAALAWAEELGL